MPQYSMDFVLEVIANVGNAQTKMAKIIELMKIMDKKTIIDLSFTGDPLKRAETLVKVVKDLGIQASATKNIVALLMGEFSKFSNVTDSTANFLDMKDTFTTAFKSIKNIINDVRNEYINLTTKMQNENISLSARQTMEGFNELGVTIKNTNGSLAYFKSRMNEIQNLPVSKQFKAYSILMEEMSRYATTATGALGKLRDSAGNLRLTSITKAAADLDVVIAKMRTMGETGVRTTGSYLGGFGAGGLLKTVTASSNEAKQQVGLIKTQTDLNKQNYQELLNAERTVTRLRVLFDAVNKSAIALAEAGKQNTTEYKRLCDLANTLHLKWQDTATAVSNARANVIEMARNSGRSGVNANLSGDLGGANTNFEKQYSRRQELMEKEARLQARLKKIDMDATQKAGESESQKEQRLLASFAAHQKITAQIQRTQQALAAENSEYTKSKMLLEQKLSAAKLYLSELTKGSNNRSLNDAVNSLLGGSYNLRDPNSRKDAMIALRGAIDATTGAYKGLNTASDANVGKLKTGLAETKKMSDGFRDLAGSVIGAMETVIRFKFASMALMQSMQALQSLVTIPAQLENSFVRLEKILDPNINSMKELRGAAFKFGETFGVSINEVIDIMYVWAQQGMQTNQIIALTNTALISMASTGLTASQSADVLTAAIRVYNIAAEDSIVVIDKLLFVQKQYAVETQDLADAIKIMGEAAQQYGISMDSLMGSVTAIIQVTRRTGNQVGNSLKTMFARFIQDDTIKYLRNIGIATTDMKGDIRSLDDILDDISARWNTLTGFQKANLATLIGGIRHYPQFMVLMDQYAVKLQATEEAQKANGFAMAAATKQTATLASQYITLQNYLKEVADSVGGNGLGLKTFAEGLLKTALAAAEFGKWLNKVSSGVSSKFIGGFITALVVAGTLRLSLKLLTAVGARIVTMFGAMIPASVNAASSSVDALTAKVRIAYASAQSSLDTLQLSAGQKQDALLRASYLRPGKSFTVTDDMGKEITLTNDLALAKSKLNNQVSSLGQNMKRSGADAQTFYTGLYNVRKNLSNITTNALIASTVLFGLGMAFKSSADSGSKAAKAIEYTAFALASIMVILPAVSVLLLGLQKLLEGTAKAAFAAKTINALSGALALLGKSAPWLIGIGIAVSIAMPLLTAHFNKGTTAIEEQNKAIEDYVNRTKSLLDQRDSSRKQLENTASMITSLKQSIDVFNAASTGSQESEGALGAILKSYDRLKPIIGDVDGLSESTLSLNDAMGKASRNKLLAAALDKFSKSSDDYSLTNNEAATSAAKTNKVLEEQIEKLRNLRNAALDVKSAMEKTQQLQMSVNNAPEILKLTKQYDDAKTAYEKIKAISEKNIKEPVYADKPNFYAKQVEEAYNETKRLESLLSRFGIAGTISMNSLEKLRVSLSKYREEAKQYNKENPGQKLIEVPNEKDYTKFLVELSKTMDGTEEGLKRFRKLFNDAFASVAGGDVSAVASVLRGLTTTIEELKSKTNTLNDVNEKLAKGYEIINNNLGYTDKEMLDMTKTTIDSVAKAVSEVKTLDETLSQLQKNAFLKGSDFNYWEERRNKVIELIETFDKLKLSIEQQKIAEGMTDVFSSLLIKQISNARYNYLQTEKKVVAEKEKQLELHKAAGTATEAEVSELESKKRILNDTRRLLDSMSDKDQLRAAKGQQEVRLLVDKNEQDAARIRTMEEVAEVQNRVAKGELDRSTGMALMNSYMLNLVNSNKEVLGIELTKDSIFASQNKKVLNQVEITKELLKMQSSVSSDTVNALGLGHTRVADAIKMQSSNMEYNNQLLDLAVKNVAGMQDGFSIVTNMMGAMKSGLTDMSPYFDQIASKIRDMYDSKTAEIIIGSLRDELDKLTEKNKLQQFFLSLQLETSRQFELINKGGKEFLDSQKDSIGVALDYFRLTGDTANAQKASAQLATVKSRNEKAMLEANIALLETQKDLHLQDPDIIDQTIRALKDEYNTQVGINDSVGTFKELLKEAQEEIKNAKQRINEMAGAFATVLTSGPKALVDTYKAIYTSTDDVKKKEQELVIQRNESKRQLEDLRKELESQPEKYNDISKQIYEVNKNLYDAEEALATMKYDLDYLKSYKNIMSQIFGPMLANLGNIVVKLQTDQLQAQLAAILFKSPIGQIFMTASERAAINFATKAGGALLDISVVMANAHYQGIMGGTNQAKTIFESIFSRFVQQLSVLADRLETASGTKKLPNVNPSNRERTDYLPFADGSLIYGDDAKLAARTAVTQGSRLEFVSLNDSINGLTNVTKDSSDNSKKVADSVYDIIRSRTTPGEAISADMGWEQFHKIWSDVPKAEYDNKRATIENSKKIEALSSVMAMVGQNIAVAAFGGGGPGAAQGANIGSQIGSAAGQFLLKGLGTFGAIFGGPLGAIAGGGLGAIIGKAFSKQDRKPAKAPEIPALKDNTEALKENTAAIESVAVEFVDLRNELINAPARFIMPPNVGNYRAGTSTMDTASNIPSNNDKSLGAPNGNGNFIVQISVQGDANKSSIDYMVDRINEVYSNQQRKTGNNSRSYR